MALTPGILRRRQRFLVGSGAGSASPVYQEFASIAAGVAGVADGEQFIVPQTSGVYHNLYTRNGSLATFNGVVEVSASAFALQSEISSAAASDTAESAPSVAYLWRTNTINKWDGRLIENIYATTNPTYNLVVDFNILRNESGAAAPTRTLWPAVTDPLGNQEAVTLAFSATTDNLDFNSSSAISRMTTATDLKMKMSVLQTSGSNDVRFGYAANTAGKYADLTPSASWQSVEAAPTDYRNAISDLCLRPVSSGTFTVYGYGLQIYDEFGATDFPSQTAERTAMLAGHAKAPFAHSGALAVDDYGWMTPVAGGENAVAVLNRQTISEWSMGVWVDFSKADYAGNWVMALSLGRQSDDINMYQKGCLGIEGGLTNTEYGRIYAYPGFSDISNGIPGSLLDQGPVHLAITNSRIDASNVSTTRYVNGVPVLTTTEAVSTFTPEFISIGGYDASTKRRQSGNGKLEAPDKLKDPFFDDTALSSADIAAMYRAQRANLGVTYQHRFFVMGSFDSLTKFPGSPFWATSNASTLRPGVYWYMDAVGGSKYGVGTADSDYIGANRQARRRAALLYACQHYERVYWFCQYGTNDLVGGVMDPAGDGWESGRDIIDGMIFDDIAYADPGNTGKVRAVIVTIPADDTLSVDREAARVAYNADCVANYATRGYYDVIDLAGWTPPGFADLEAAAADANASATGNAIYQNDGRHWQVVGGSYLVTGGSYAADDLFIPFLENELNPTPAVATLSNFIDDLEQTPPTIVFDSDQEGTGVFDFHTSITPPAIGEADIATFSTSVVNGENTYEFDLSAYPAAEGYVHIRVQNANGTSNTLTSQQITVPGSDTDAPTITAVSPLDNETDVSTTNSLVATFSENVAFGTGNIVLRKNDGGWADEETFDVTTDVGTGAGQVSISGNNLTINPTADLDSNTEYAVRIASTAIDDANANSFAGIADDTTWSFTTGLDSDVVAYLAAMNEPPDATRQALINDLVTSLKTDGVWTKLYGLWIFAAHNDQAARINLKSPANSLTVSGSPTFTTDRGYAGDASSAYLRTEFLGSSITRTNFCWGAVVDVASGTNLSKIMGYALNTADLAHSTQTNGSRARMGATNSTSVSGGANDQFVAGRRTGTTQDIVLGTSFLGSSTATDSSSSSSNPIDILRATTGYTNARLQCAFLAQYLDNTEVLALRTALVTYGTAVGAI